MSRGTLRARDRAPVAPALPPGRVVWIDTLKVVTIAGVVAFHAATAYLTDVAGWYYEERTTSQLSAWLVGAPGALLALFLLGPLFLVGGALAAPSLARAGPRRFARARLARLGVPLVLFVVVLDPLADLIGHTAQGLGPELWETVGPASEIRVVGPMWFVAALLAFCLGYAGWRRWVPARTPPRELRAAHLVAAAVVLGVASFLVRGRWPFMGDVVLELRFAQWPQGAVLFTMGVMLGERGGVGLIPEVWRRHAGAVAGAGMLGVVLLGGTLLASGGDLEPMLGGWTWASAVLALLEGATATTVSVWAIDHARRWWIRSRPLIARAARGSYAAYVLHPLVLVLLSWGLHPVPWPPEAKFLVVATLGVVGSFTIGWALTRIRTVGRVR